MSIDVMSDLKPCRDLPWGRIMHAKAAETQRAWEVYTVNALTNMYRKCGSILDAQNAFYIIKEPDVVLWTTLLLAYAENGEGYVVLDLFSRMKMHGCLPDSFTYIAVLKACTSVATNADESGKEDSLEVGRRIHLEIGCHLNLYIQNTLINFYSKCGNMLEASRVFDSIEIPSVVSWTNLLLGYAENGEGHIALELLSRMKAAGSEPDSVAYIASLKACISLAMTRDGSKTDSLERGRRIHLEIGCHLDQHVQGTLIDMYCKCDSLVDARLLFDSIDNPNLICWNTLLLGYVDNGEGLSALNLLQRMKTMQGCTPDCLTYVGALKACSLVGALSLGRKFHSEISEFTAHVVTCLVDFYAKCGSMVEARAVFMVHSGTRNITTWNALLAGYGNLGDSVSVFNMFDEMEDEGVRANAITFLAMLSCCSHAGLVEKAWEYFMAMHLQHAVTPGVVHFNCMVDILGRANQLNKAVAIIQKMACRPSVVTWMTLLGACRKWKNVYIGRGAFRALLDIDKKNAYAYVLMAYIYNSQGMWEEQALLLEMRNR